jgi:hypothetical protein
MDLEGTNKLDDNGMKAIEYRNEQWRLSQGTRQDEKSFAFGDSAPKCLTDDLCENSFCLPRTNPAYATLCDAHNRNDAAVLQAASKENV